MLTLGIHHFSVLSSQKHCWPLCSYLNTLFLAAVTPQSSGVTTTSLASAFLSLADPSFPAQPKVLGCTRFKPKPYSLFPLLFTELPKCSGFQIDIYRLDLSPDFQVHTLNCLPDISTRTSRCISDLPVQNKTPDFLPQQQKKLFFNLPHLNKWHHCAPCNQSRNLAVLLDSSILPMICTSPSAHVVSSDIWIILK